MLTLESSKTPRFSLLVKGIYRAVWNIGCAVFPNPLHHSRKTCLPMEALLPAWQHDEWGTVLPKQGILHIQFSQWLTLTDFAS